MKNVSLHEGGTTHYEAPACVTLQLCTQQILCASIEQYEEFEVNLDD